METIWVSLRQDSGKSGRIGRSIKPGSENFFFRGAAFALEETAGNFFGGVGVFAVVHGERKKIAVIHRRGNASGG